MRIESKNVSFSYPGGPDVLRDLSFAIESGEFLLLVGQNGAGKSTLLKLLNGLLKPTHGSISIGELDTRHHATPLLAGHISVTFQNPADQIFASTVREEVAFSPTNLRRANARELTEKALALCNLQSVASHHPYDLPQAQRKLVTVAGALAAGTTFLAFDEPTAGLSQIERSVLDQMVTHLLNEGRGFIVVSHDLELFFRHATRVAVLSRGGLTFTGKTRELIESGTVLEEAGLRLPTSFQIKRRLKLP